ncbi:unnamed protein product [Arabidopsis arenosa]|uniref:NYN domain-containing protein n=1 Tax=Arabidopsis arenosa TaxID=38785 RepID=A0A8S1ZHE1_ARAAE|nr:unnamed protein product [Arabidopsis arenosa]
MYASTGVEVVSLGLPRPKRNAADSAIVEDIIKFCNKKERVGEPVNILIASGDKNVMLEAWSKSKKRNRSIVWLGVSVDPVDQMPAMTALWTWRSFLLMEEEAPPKVPLIEYNELEYRNVGPLPWTAEEMKRQVKSQKHAAKKALKDAKEALKEDEGSDEEARDVGQEVNVSKKKRARELVPEDEVNVSRKKQKNKKRVSELDPEE